MPGITDPYLSKGKNNSYLFPLDILFIVNPIKTQLEVVDLPVYVALLDNNNKLIEMQYFAVKGKLEYNKKLENYTETELTKSLSILSKKNNDVYILVIGFMLDKEKKGLLN